jgi:hypothetical protein
MIKLFLFVPCILNRVYIVMYVIMFSEVPLPQYLTCLTVVLQCLKEFYVCVWLGGTPFVLFVITVLCIAISCSVENAFTCIFKDLERLHNSCSKMAASANPPPNQPYFRGFHSTEIWLIPVGCASAGREGRGGKCGTCYYEGSRNLMWTVM